MERFSMREVLKEKNTKTAKSTKKVEKKDGGKYVTKFVDGVKYMVLK